MNSRDDEILGELTIDVRRIPDDQRKLLTVS